VLDEFDQLPPRKHQMVRSGPKPITLPTAKRAGSSLTGTRQHRLSTYLALQCGGGILCSRVSAATRAAPYKIMHVEEGAAEPRNGY
jgi:hypothetical protein